MECFFFAALGSFIWAFLILFISCAGLVGFQIGAVMCMYIHRIIRGARCVHFLINTEYTEFSRDGRNLLVLMNKYTYKYASNNYT